MLHAGNRFARGWTLVDVSGNPIQSGHTWTYSADVANVDVIGLARYSALLIQARNVTLSAAGVRCVTVSVDNGVSFFNAGGDYKAVSAAGAETDSSVFLTHDTASNLARTLLAEIPILNAFGPKWGQSIGTAGNKDKLFVGSNAAINAIRLFANTGNLTGGTLDVYAR